MTLSLYMDHHVPSAVTTGLRQRDVDVLTAAEDGADTHDDPALLDRATSLGRVLFSQDKDLLEITHQWLLDGRDFAGLVYAHQLSISVGQAIRDLELIAKVLEPDDIRNRVEYIPYT
jgi:hypothetical protein